MASWIKPVLYTLIGIVILGLAGYSYLLSQKSRADAARWKRIADQKYKEGRSEASQILRAAVDQITDEKSRITQMTDRELLTEAVLGIAGLGRRLDRVEDDLRFVNQLDEILMSINDQAQLLTQNAQLLGNQVTEAQNSAASFQSAVAGTSEAVYSLSDSTHDIEQLLTDVKDQLGSLSGVSQDFSDLQSRMDAVLARMNQTLKVTSANPAAALSQMDSRISSIYNQLQNMSEGLNLMAQSLEGVQDTLNAVNTRTRSIHGDLQDSLASDPLR